MSEVLIIGAGIVGLSTAYALLRDGHAITILDIDPPGDKASFGNAGGLGVTEIVPAGVPGLIWKVPGWLLDPLGPLSLKPSHLPRLLPWLWRFMRASTPAEVERITKALAALTAPVYDDFLPLLSQLDLMGDLHRVGALWVYESEDSFRADGADRDLRRRYGIVFDELTGAEARELEPALSPTITRAAMTPQWSHLSDPKRVVDRLRDYVAAQGVRFVVGKAMAISEKTVRTQHGHSLPFDQLVVAAGAWSERLARTTGDRMLLESERGYNTTVPQPSVHLTREVIFAETKFVATPLDIGLRIGGAAEFAGLDAEPNYARSRALGELAKRYLPGLTTDGGTAWMGHRPTTADSLPVISHSRHRKDVIYACGHGHTGLTLGPTTGRIVADLIAGRPSSIDLSPFSITRF
jgi:D-amino-acid dehydrogenase